jgi:hypothetical protein
MAFSRTNTKIDVSNRAAATRWAMAHRVVDGAPDG